MLAVAKYFDRNIFGFRVGKNEVSTLWGSCEYSFLPFLNFYLGNYEDQWVEEMERKWGDYLSGDYGIDGVDFIPEGFVDEIKD